MGAMAEDVRAVAAALEEGRRYERAERERRIGLAYIVSGATFAGIFLAYGVLMTLPPESVPRLAWALAWVPFVVAATLARRKLFRRLPTGAEQLTAMPAAGRWAFVAAWLAIAFGLGGYLHRPRLAYPAVVAVFAVAYAVQARRFRDRIHAIVAAGMILFAAGLLLLPTMVAQAFATGIGVGLSLVALGIVRWRGSRA